MKGFFGKKRTIEQPKYSEVAGSLIKGVVSWDAATNQFKYVDENGTTHKLIKVPVTTGMLEGAPLVNGLAPNDYVMFFDDFITIALDDQTGFPTDFVIVSDAAGTTGDGADGLGGWLTVACTNTDNNETYLSSLNGAFIFNATKKVYFEARLKLREGSTNTANWIIGLSNTVAANSLLDNGGGPMASYDGAVFFKTDGAGMKIQFETSNAGTQVTNATLSAFVSGTVYKVGFVYDPLDGTTGRITPYVNDVAGTPHAITIAGLEEMHILVGVKTGSAHVAALLVDYIYVAQER